MIDPLPEHRLSLNAIWRAQELIDPVLLQSPQYEPAGLSEHLGCHLTLKVETANPLRSFKGRGAVYFLEEVARRGDDRELVCASTGNFGQAMAYACRSHDRSLTVFADESANTLKMSRIEKLGAVVRRVGRDFDGAKASARAHCESSGAWMVEDGKEPEISEGAGTIGVELTGRGDEFDVVLVPVGNGALISGVGRWIKAASPRTRVLGVSASGADAMAESWRRRETIERPSAHTVAEGIAVRVPVPEAVDDMLALVDDMLLVSDIQMIEAVRLIHDVAGQLVEPSGAAGVAAITADPAPFSGLRVATILTGSNLTDEQMRDWLI